MSTRITSIRLSSATLRRYYDYEIRLNHFISLGLPDPHQWAFTPYELTEYMYLHILYCLDLRLNSINYDDLPF